MSISSALANALTGLAATARAANVTSSNLANVLTEGYAPRSVELSAQTLGQRSGVQVVGVTRQVDMALLADRRLADAELAYTGTLVDFADQLERLIGIPGEPGSLSTRIADFDASLISAASKPEAEERLFAAVARADELATALRAASSDVQARRTEADSQIARAVDTVNTTLEQIQRLNVQIGAAGGDSGVTASLEDQRQRLIDRLSEFVPTRQVPRDSGSVALFTPGGAVLLDGTAATLEFSQSNVIAPQMTLQNGLLSGLQINGVSVAPSGNASPVRGGKLAALFEIRDLHAPDAQTQLDALARDLIERFQAPGLDPTLGAADAGLFTDAGARFDVVDEVGVSGRIALNSSVDPDAGGALWRLRNGLGAAAPGAPGDATLLQAFQSAVSVATSLGSGDLGLTARSLSEHLSSFVSRIGQQRLTQENALSFAAVLQSELAMLERENGVDTDAELQKLLLIEQAYAANARLIETADDMIQTLLRI